MRDADRRELRRKHLLHGDALHEHRVVLRLRADRRDALGVGLLERAPTLRARTRATSILTLKMREKTRARASSNLEHDMSSERRVGGAGGRPTPQMPQNRAHIRGPRHF